MTRYCVSVRALKALDEGRTGPCCLDRPKRSVPPPRPAPATNVPLFLFPRSTRIAPTMPPARSVVSRQLSSALVVFACYCSHQLAWLSMPPLASMGSGHNLCWPCSCTSREADLIFLLGVCLPSLSILSYIVSFFYFLYSPYQFVSFPCPCLVFSLYSTK